MLMDCREQIQLHRRSAILRSSFLAKNWAEMKRKIVDVVWVFNLSKRWIVSRWSKVTIDSCWPDCALPWTTRAWSTISMRRGWVNTSTPFKHVPITPIMWLFPDLVDRTIHCFMAILSKIRRSASLCIERICPHPHTIRAQSFLKWASKSAPGRCGIAGEHPNCGA